MTPHTKKEIEKCCDWRTQEECPIHSSNMCEYCERMLMPHKIKDCEYHREIRISKFEKLTT